MRVASPAALHYAVYGLLEDHLGCKAFAHFEALSAPKTLKPYANLWINVVSSARSQNAAGD